MELPVVEKVEKAKSLRPEQRMDAGSCGAGQAESGGGPAVSRPVGRVWHRETRHGKHSPACPRGGPGVSSSILQGSCATPPCKAVGSTCVPSTLPGL